VITSNGGIFETYFSEQKPPPPYIVKETIRYVREHLHEIFNIKDMAAHLRCHPDFLSRKFKQHSGVDLSLYIRRIRINHAMELLKNPVTLIDDVAEQCGFSDRVHFTKVFRKLTGQTPGQFQKQFRQSKNSQTSHKVDLNTAHPRSNPK
jgi:transcriptional regulator GlxA family with amidase domain